MHKTKQKRQKCGSNMVHHGTGQSDTLQLLLAEVNFHGEVILLLPGATGATNHRRATYPQSKYPYCHSKYQCKSY